MKLTDENTIYIQKTFAELKTKEDLLELLTYAKKILCGETALPFKMRSLNFHAFAVDNPDRYFTFTIKKKNGDLRTILAPNKGLKILQRSLNLIFQALYKPHSAAYGFIPERSVVNNASLHTRMNYVYNIDLKDFFPSVEQARIWACLQLPPFNLNKQTSRLDLANTIAALCCNKIEVERLEGKGNSVKVLINVLPQGAPTSPTLTNIVCQKLDRKLSGAAKKFGLKYSRYADDITFSSLHDCYQDDSEFIKELNRIIAEQGFTINQSKTRVQKRNGYRQEVTGLVVNDKVNVQRRYIKQVRLLLHWLETLPQDLAAKKFQNYYTRDRKRSSSIDSVLKGKLDYLKMVETSESVRYLKLAKRLDRITGNKKLSEDKGIEDQILDLVLSGNILKAMNLYKSNTG